MTKLPVVATIKEAYRAAWEGRWLALRFAAAPFAIFLLLPVLTIELGRPIWTSEMIFDRVGGIWYVIPPYLVSLLAYAVLVPFAVQSYRLFLLGSEAVAADGWFRVGRESLGMLAVFSVIYVMFFVMLIVGIHLFLALIPESIRDIKEQFLGNEYLIWLAMSAIFLVFWPFVYVVVRIIFVLPHICLNRRWDLPARWREGRGNVGRLALCLILALSPVLILTIVATDTVVVTMNDRQITAGLSPLWFIPHNVEAPAFEWLHIWALGRAALSGAIHLVLSFLSAAVTVVAFANLTGYSAKGVRIPTTAAPTPDRSAS